MNNPLVSICIPAYNGANYINKSITACLAQTYTNIEVIVCDDGSTDATFSLLNEWMQKDKRVKVFKNSSNLGLVGNWNATLGHASGEYIKWLFQDDWMEPTAIAEFVEVAQKGYGLIVSKRHFVLDAAATKEDELYYQQLVKKLEDHFPSSESGHLFTPASIANLATDYIALNFIAEPSLTFFKRSLALKTGPYDALLHQICDLDYNLRLAEEAGVYVINKPLCHFAIHANSTTSSNLNNKYFQLRFVEQSYFAYKLLQHPDYAALQKQFSLTQKLKLKLYYTYRMHEAKRFIAKQTDRSAYDSILRNYPFLKQSTMAEVLMTPVFAIIDVLKSRR
jgi:glycosyltransferase involved in cell wall biosynthesis